MTAKHWTEVETAIEDAVDRGKLLDWRGVLPTHKTRTFRQRETPADILGVCTHHGASTNQDPRKTARYHVGPNHISDKGCPGIVYGAVISDEVAPEQVILCHNLFDITWSQGKGGDKPEYSGDENRHLLSVLVMGDFDEDDRPGKSGDPSTSQIGRWRWFTSWLEGLFGFGGMGHFGHYHFGKFHCPGRAMREQIRCRRAGCIGLTDDRAWQEALLRWDPTCMPKYGADGDWGGESKRALVAFERAHKHKVDGVQDPFTELLLQQNYSKSA